MNETLENKDVEKIVQIIFLISLFKTKYVYFYNLEGKNYILGFDENILDLIRKKIKTK